MAAPGRNEGIRVLDDFVSEAVPAPGGSQAVRGGRGTTPGMRVVPEGVSRPPQPPVSAARVAELRGLSTRQLLALVRRSAAALDDRELLVIHDIAAERLGEDNNPFLEGAV